MRFWERFQLLLGFSHPPQTAAGSARPTIPNRGDTKVVRLNAASKAALSNALRALQPGQKGWISFDDAERGGARVAAIENGVVHMRKVTIARDFGTQVEVSDGLKDGDQVILNPSVNLADGSKAEAHPERTASSN